MVRTKLQTDQSVLDFCLVNTGAISSLFDLLKLNGLTSLDIEPGTVLMVPEVLKPEVVEFFSRRVLATEPIVIQTVSSDAPSGTIQNSDESFTLEVNSGAVVTLDDITVTLSGGSESQTFPSNVDIDLSGYYASGNPVGVFYPDVVPGENRLQWINVSSNCEVGLGVLEKTSGNNSYDQSGGFLIPTTGDFKLLFTVNYNLAAWCGLSFDPMWIPGGQLEQAFSMVKVGGTALSIYRYATYDGVSVGAGFNSPFRIERIGTELSLYQGEETTPLISYIVANTGQMYFATSIYSDNTEYPSEGSGKIYDISVEFL